MDAFFGMPGRDCEDSGADKMHRPEHILVQAMSMPHGMRCSCSNDYLLCVCRNHRHRRAVGRPVGIVKLTRGEMQARRGLQFRRVHSHRNMMDAIKHRDPMERRLSNKQSLVICANFERGLSKNAAHPPVDGGDSESQNQQLSSILWNCPESPHKTMNARP
jgi:hypothetical protein